MKKKVLISFPTSPKQPYLHKVVVFCSWRLLADPRYSVKAIIPTHNPFENNLHKIVNQFLREGHDYWLSIDADNPPMKNPLDLVELDKDVIGCPTPVWYYAGGPRERPIYWNAYDYVPEKGAYAEHEPKEGLQRVDAVGTGCFLVTRRVFEHPEMQKGAFIRKLYADGTVDKGNDLSFAERAREQGFEIWCHYDYPCRHFNELDLVEVLQAFQKLYETHKDCV